MICIPIKLNDLEFNELRDIIQHNSGILFSDNKKYLIENRLSRRLADLNFTTFKDYIYNLKYDFKRHAEIGILINLITINETSFLRERGQMDYLISTIIPELLKKKKSIRIWSIPCSTGEEPYSLAILLTDAGLYSKASIEIIATDINSDVVDIAKEGNYRSSSFRGCLDKFTENNFTLKDNIYKLNTDIKSKVKFNTGNVLNPTFVSSLGKLDIIFCRNMLIYFDMDSKKKTINMFELALNNDGHLFLGHSEILSRISTNFNSINFGTGIVYTKR